MLRRADRLGAPPARALAALAEEARARQTRRAAERAARAAPKIQLVVALLLVPSVLLLVAAALVPRSRARRCRRPRSAGAHPSGYFSVTARRDWTLSPSTLPPLVITPSVCR